MVRQMLAQMPLAELFDWYDYHLEQWGISSEHAPDHSQANIDEEIALMRGAFGG